MAGGWQTTDWWHTIQRRRRMQIGRLVLFIVLRGDDPAVVKFEELRLAILQQDKASHEVAPVGQVDIENIGARRQSGHPEETVRIGRRRARILTAVADLDYSAGKNFCICRIDHPSDQLRCAGGRAINGQQDREAHSKRPFCRRNCGHAHHPTTMPALAAAAEAGFLLPPPMARAKRTLMPVFS